MIDQEKLNNQEETVTFNQTQDEDYGLPEVVFEPIASEEVVAEYQEPVQEPVKPKITEPEQKSSSWPIWLGVVVLLALAGFSLYFFVFDKQKEAPVTPPPVVQQVEPQPEPAPIVEETAPVTEEWTPAQPQEGSVTTISTRTGRYYLVVGSFIDSDMAADYAAKLSKQGNQVTILAPNGDRKFYRLGVKEGASFAELSEDLETYKSTYGPDIWIVRY